MSVYNHIRGLSPFPGAWTELEHNTQGSVLPLKIFKTQKIMGQFDQKAGEIDTDGKQKFEVYVVGGKLQVLELQLSGKKRMKVEDFLRGFPLSDYHIRV